MQVTQVIGYCLIVGVLLPWVGSRRQVWPCVFVVVTAGATTPLVGFGMCAWLGLPFPDWMGGAGLVGSSAVYAGCVAAAWAWAEPVMLRAIGPRLAAAVRRSLVGVARRRAALRDVRRAARGQQTLDYRIEVE